MIEEAEQQVVELWAAFDLTGRKVGLDKQLIELRESKAAAVERRKALNEATKRFRALDKAEQLGAVTELLKQYQSEIDLLTKRSKAGEAAFVALYKALYEVPDPVSALTSLMRRLEAAACGAIEVVRLQGELRQYEEEFRGLKNQDIKIRHLEEQLRRFQESIDDRVEEAVAERAAEVERRAEERVRESEERVRQAERRASEASEGARAAQAASERAQQQLLQVSSAADRMQTDLVNENLLLVDANHRLQARLAELESVLSARSAGAAGEQESALRSREERELRDRVAELQLQLQVSEESLRAERTRADAGAEDSARQLQRLAEELDRTRAELTRRPSETELMEARRQLLQLQRMVYRVEDEGEEETSGNSLITPAASSGSASLETVMAAKLRSLESQLIDCRTRLGERTQGIAELTERNRALAEAEARSRALVAKLEADLEALGQADDRKQSSLADLSTLIDVAAPSVAVSASKAAELAEASKAASMASILQGQRDRYKARLAQSEEEVRSLQQQLSAARQERERLQKDNVELYAKIRYLQTYGQTKSNDKFRLDEESGGHAEVSFRHVTSEAVEVKYRGIYESRLSPFEQFSQLEKQRKVAELSAADRLVLNTVTACVASPAGRSAMLAYIAVMHVLVFVTLYFTAHRVHHECPPCIHSAASNLLSAASVGT